MSVAADPSARVDMHWSDFDDPESGVVSYRWAVGASCGGGDIVGWTPLGGSTAAAFMATQRGGVDSLVLSVSATNRAGLQVTACLSIVVDETPPTFCSMAVIAGWRWWSDPSELLVDDLHAMFSRTADVPLIVSPWAAQDAQSPITALTLEIRSPVESSPRGPVPVFTRTIPTNATLPTNVTFAASSSELGRRSYTAFLRATNAAGMVSVSEPQVFFVDAQPPASGEACVCDAQGKCIAAQSQTTRLRICTSGSVSPPSRIRQQNVQIELASSGELLHDASVLFAVEAGSFWVDDLQLPCGQLIRVLTTARSGAGVAALTLSSKVRVDCTPPSPGDYVGFGGETQRVRCFGVADGVSARWSSFVDEESAISSYEYAVVHSRVPNATVWYAAGLRLLVRIDITELESAPSSYALHVRACNDAALCEEHRSASRLAYVPDAPGAGEVSLASVGGFLPVGASTIEGSFSFADASENVSSLQYEVCIGTTPKGCQLSSLQPTAGSPVRLDGLSLSCGLTYYLLVRATNCAGLQRTATSSGVTICCDPPVAGKLELVDGYGDALTHLSGELKLSARWHGFRPSCGGIEEVTLSLVSATSGATPLWSTNVSDTSGFMSLPEARLSALLEGGVYSITVRATSPQGLHTEATAQFTVERDPPRLLAPTFSFWPRALEDGVSPNVSRRNASVCMPATATGVDVSLAVEHGTGCVGIRYELALADSVAARTNATGALKWRSVGASRTLRLLPASFFAAPGSTHFVSRACCASGQCGGSPFSEGIVGLAEAPAAPFVQIANAADGLIAPGELTVQFGQGGTVSSAVCRPDNALPVCAGPHERCFYDARCLEPWEDAHGGLGCNAGGKGKACRFCGFGEFALVECPSSKSLTAGDESTRLSYEVCVGTVPFGCQAQAFTSVSGGDWRANLSLTCGTTYYATVRATNCAGRQTSAVSEGVTLCCDPPVAGTVWLQDGTGAKRSVVGVADVANRSAARMLSLWWSGFGAASRCGPLKKYSVSLQHANGSVLWTSTALSQLTHVHELPIAALRQLQHGVWYNLLVRASGGGGRSVTASTRVLFDATPPSAGSLTVRWHGVGLAVEDASRTAFVDGPTTLGCLPGAVATIELEMAALVDLESGVAQYSVGLLDSAAKTLSIGMDGSGGEASTNRSIWAWSGAASVTNLPASIFSQTNLSYLIGRACNPLGLCSTTPWLGVQRVQAAPTTGGVVASLPFEGSREQAALSMPMVVSWTGFLSGASSFERLSYEVCVGTVPFGCQAQAFTSVSGGDWRANLSLTCGTTYYATVRATNCAGRQTSAVSEGVTLCCDPPVAGTVWLQDGTGVKRSRVGANRTLTVAWAGFHDACRGLTGYRVRVLERGSTHVLWESRNLTELEFALELPRLLMARLADAGRFDVALQAQTGRAGVVTERVAQLTVDRTPPTLGSVWLGTEGAKRGCHRAADPLPVGWHGIADSVSGVHSVELALGQARLADDLVPFALASEDGSVPRFFANVSSFAGRVVYATVRVRNHAGASSTQSSWGVRIVEDQCAGKYICLPSI